MRVFVASLVSLVLLAVALPAAAQVVEACPAISPPNDIVINEIMYDSPGNPDVEYIEIFNSGAGPVDLTNWFVLDDNDTHDKCFLAGTLAAGDYLVVAGFNSLFTAKYPGVTNVNANEFDDAVMGQGFVLGDGGDAVRVFDAGGVLVDCVLYNDTPPWPTEPDGDGPSLELYNPVLLDNSLATSWAPSTNGPPEGTPGAVNSVFTTDPPPIVSDIARDTPLPSNSDTVTVTVLATDTVGLSMVELLVDSGSGFVPQLMFDDGMHGDNGAGDNTFGSAITPKPNGTLVRYYVRATDTGALTTTLPPDAPTDYVAYTVGHQLPALVINEILASNLTGIMDETGTREDWLEIRNAGGVPVDLDGMYLSNSLFQPQEWQLPDMTLAPGAYVVVWADDDVPDGPLHTNFKLSASGSAIAIWESIDHGNVMIHGYKFGVQSADVAYGYFPQASGDVPEYLSTPTPGASNNTSALFSSIVINEFQTTSAGGGTDDWVEFYNRGNAIVDMSGWHVTDEVDQPTRYTISNGVFLIPGSYQVFNENELGFSFASTGAEVIMLTDATGAGKDFYDYGPQTADITEGRFPDGTANWYAFQTTTLGLSNSCDVVSGQPCSDGDPCTSDACNANSCESTFDVCSVSGEVFYYRNGLASEPSTKPVAGIDIDIDTDLVADATTGVGGDYSVAATGTVDVTPLDEIQAEPHPFPDAPVSSFDATFIAQHSVGLITLSANQLLAGDVSGNGTVSAFDAAFVAQFSAEIIDHFAVAVAAESDWAFLRCDNYVDATNHDCGAPLYSHDPLLGAEVDDFYAVLYGDVTGNWQPDGLAKSDADEEAHVGAEDRVRAGLLSRTASASRLDLLTELAGGQLRPGVTFAIRTTLDEKVNGVRRRTFELTVDQGDGILGLDVELRSLARGAAIVDVRTADLAADFDMVTNDLGTSYRVGLYNALPIEGSGSVISITVEERSAGRRGLPFQLVVEANEQAVPVRTNTGRARGSRQKR